MIKHVVKGEGGSRNSGHGLAVGLSPQDSLHNCCADAVVREFVQQVAGESGGALGVVYDLERFKGG